MHEAFEPWLQKQLQTDEPEPFCPFGPAYCNDAYNFDCCRLCEAAMNTWKDVMLNGTD